jgi:predicted phage terminase large subunit-like protein
MALLIDPMYDILNPGFTAVIFRRTYPDIRQEGGLWDSSASITTADGQQLSFYPGLGGVPTESRLEWAFPSGATIRFAHMESESDRFNYLGAQIPFIGFDQLEGFTEKQFWSMLACNRSTCGAKTRMRFTCNPHPDHFLRELLRWWIDDDTGLPIPERAGAVRWFARMSGEIVWADTAAEVKALCGPDSEPLSFAFFPSTVFDNPILLARDPAYLSKLKGLGLVERERMLGGNWNVRETAGTIFKREWFKIVDAAPVCHSIIRYWDRASTPAAAKNAAKASWTSGAKLGLTANGLLVIHDVRKFQASPHEVEEQVKNTASQDGRGVEVGIEGDPGQAGVAEAQYYVRALAGYIVTVNPVHESKGVRARPVSSQAEAGNVLLVRGPWNEAFLRECENFDGTPGTPSDQVDSVSGGYYLLTKTKLRAGVW